MDTLYQHARRLAFDNTSSAVNGKSRLDLFKEMDGFFMQQLEENYDVQALVGNPPQPLIHALVKEKTLKLTWMKYFIDHPNNHPLFENFEGQNLGQLMINRLIKSSSMSKEDVAPFALWIKSNPNLDKDLAQKWLIQLAQYIPNTSYSYGSEEKVGHQELIKILDEQGVQLKVSTPNRPPERWQNQEVFLNKINEENRWEEWVYAPSGELRLWKDFLNLTDNLAYNKRQFGQKRDDYYQSKAPHGRKKELIDGYVLGLDSDRSIESRVDALKESIKASDGAWEEFCSRLTSPSPRYPLEKVELAKQVLNWKDAMGMGVVSWLVFKEGENFLYPRGIDQYIEQSTLINEKGEGLLSQYLNHYLNSFQNGRVGLSLSHNHSLGFTKEEWIGEGPEVEKLVNHLVDMLIAISPSHEARTIAKFLDESELLSDHPPLAQKLNQARVLSFLPEALRSTHQMKQSEYQHGKRKGSLDFSRVDSMLAPIYKTIENDCWHFSLTLQDWDHLKRAWMFDAPRIALRSSWKEKLENLDQTIQRYAEKTELSLNQDQQSFAPRKAMRL